VCWVGGCIQRIWWFHLPFASKWLIRFSDLFSAILVLLDPVETPVQQTQLVGVIQAEFHVNPVAVHVSIKDQLIRPLALEIELRLPVLVLSFCQRERLLV
jgi:hypothetical protein